MDIGVELFREFGSFGVLIGCIVWVFTRWIPQERERSRRQSEEINRQHCANIESLTATFEREMKRAWETSAERHKDLIDRHLQLIGMEEKQNETITTLAKHVSELAQQDRDDRLMRSGERAVSG